MSQCVVVMLSDDKCPVLAGDCGDIPQSPRLQLVVVCCLNTVNRLTISHVLTAGKPQTRNK